MSERGEINIVRVKRRPREHSRKLHSGKRIVINRGVKSTANKVIRNIRKSAKKIEIAGSIRRRKMANDIDLVVVPIDKHAILDKIKSIGDIIASGDRQIFAKVGGVKVDIFFATPKEFGAQLMTRTGPVGANIKNRTIAREKGMLLNQYGLFNRKTGKRLAISERSIYRHLGKSYRPPEKRGSPRKNYGAMPSYKVSSIPVYLHISGISNIPQSATPDTIEDTLLRDLVDVYANNPALAERMKAKLRNRVNV